MKHAKILVSLALAFSSCLSVYEMYELPKPEYLLSYNDNGKSKEMLTKDDLINSFVSSNTFSQTQMIEVIHSLLVSKYGNEYLKEAQSRYEQNVNTSENQTVQSLQLQGMTPQSYLDSIQNYLIIQNKIFEQYKPTHKELMKKYKSLENKYWIEGIYLTNKKTSPKQSIKEIKKSIEDGSISLNEIYKKKSFEGYAVSGIGLNGSFDINQISSDDYKTIDDEMQDKIDKAKQGQILSGYDESYGHYIIKIKKIQKPGTFKQEKASLTKQIKYNKSVNVNEQTKFIQRLFKESKVKSQDKNIEKLIKTIESGE